MTARFVQRDDQVMFSMMMSYKRPDIRQKKADSNGYQLPERTTDIFKRVHIKQVGCIYITQKIWIKSDYVSLLLKLFTVSLKFTLLYDMTSKPLMTWRWLPPSACLYPAPTSNLPGYGTLFFYSYKTLHPVVLMFHTSVPLHILLFFPPGMSILLLIILQNHLSVLCFPDWPLHSSAANSVMHMVEFLSFYTVVWLFKCTSIPRVLIICAGTFIHQLFTEWPLCKTPYIVLWIQQ